MTMTPMRKVTKRLPLGGQGSGRAGHDLLGGERAGDRQHGHDHKVAADEHRQCERQIVKRRIGVEPGESAAVGRRPRGEGVKHLGKSRAGRYSPDRRAPLGDARYRGQPENGERYAQIASIVILTSVAAIFLPTYSGVRPIISPATNTATITNSSMPNRPEPGAADNDLVEHHIRHRTPPPSGVKLSSIALTAPSRRVGGHRGKQRRHRRPEADLFAFHIAAGLQFARQLIDAEARQSRVAVGLGSVNGGDADDIKNRHRGEQCPALASLPIIRPKVLVKAGANHKDQQHFDQVGCGRRVLERMRGIDIEKAAAVRADQS